MNNHLTWTLVDSVAADLNVPATARMKWRQREVPAKHRIAITQELMKRGIAISLADFDQLPVTPGRIAA